MKRLTLLLCLLVAGACTSLGDHAGHDVVRVPADGILPAAHLACCRAGQPGARNPARGCPLTARPYRV